MCNRKQVLESLTKEDIKVYARSWGCGREEAIRRLQKLVIV